MDASPEVIPEDLEEEKSSSEVDPRGLVPEEIPRQSKSRRLLTGISIATFLFSIFRLVTVLHLRNEMASLGVFETVSPNDRKRAPHHDPLKILYMITTSREFNNGARGTIQGQDRLMEMVMPVVLESVHSMISSSHQVDVYLILAYELKPQRRERIQNMLPEGVGLQVWSGAEPYDYEKGSDKIVPIDRALARQHRYVVRDKYDYYDLFCAFEDDMVIKAEHIHNYLQVSKELQRLKARAPEPLNNGGKGRFFGELAPKYLERMRPGFLRVEVVLEANEGRVPKGLLPKELNSSLIPADFNFTNNGTIYHAQVDPQTCCHVQYLRAPPKPTADDLIVWESGIASLAVREMPQPSWLGWVAMIPGNGRKAADYWAGANGALSGTRPHRFSPEYLAQSAGWMMTPREILELDEALCHGGFIPPFEATEFPRDGLHMNNVEFWSGGIQMWCDRCNIQRIIPLEPDRFSKHLLYHSANNKQKVIPSERLVRVNGIFGQLNSVKKAAELAKRNIIAVSQPKQSSNHTL